MRKKRILNTERKLTIDHGSGEVLQTEITNKSFADTEPQYVKMYISDIARLNGLPPAADKVLMEIIGQMGYQNIFPAYAPVKKIIAAALNISMNTLNKSIDQLVKKEILIRMDRGMYLVDPELFARGRWEDIKKIRLVIEYDAITNKKILKSDAPNQLNQLALNFSNDK